MADLITIKGGSGNVPTLQDRELAVRKDTKALYVGINNENVKVGDAGWETRIKALEDKPSGMFYAIYGETTGEEINAAYQAGKGIACKLPDGKVLYLTVDWMTGNGFTFSATDYLKVTTVEVSGDWWSDITIQPFATKEYVDSLVADINARLDALTPSE